MTGKSIVLYYSRTGKTAIAAKAIVDKLSADIIEIKDLKNRMGILNWLRAGKDAGGRKTTQIQPDIVDIKDYNTVCLGTPTWGGKPTPAINTVIRNLELDGKNVILFVTLGGSSYENVLNIMKEEVEAKGGKVIKTIPIVKSGKKSDEDIVNEINEMEIAG